MEQHFLGAKVFMQKIFTLGYVVSSTLPYCNSIQSRHKFIGNACLQNFGIFVLLMNTVASYISGFVLVVVPAVGT